MKAIGFFALALSVATGALAQPSAAPAPAAGPVKVDSETISGLGARNIGSAEMSGRVAAIDAIHDGDRLTVYVGAASGGVWKSLNGGTTYKPVFDKTTVQSIGAVTIDSKSPQTAASCGATATTAGSTRRPTAARRGTRF